MNELVQKLADGNHPVVITAVRDDALDELRAAIDRGYVHVKFTETRGGTELGFRLDEEHSDLSKGDLEKGSGNIRLAGNLILDGVPVRCEADVDLGKMAGEGHLVILESEAPAAAAEDKPN